MKTTKYRLNIIIVSVQDSQYTVGASDDETPTIYGNENYLAEQTSTRDPSLWKQYKKWSLQPT